jgi:hypothetical protein
MKLEASTGISFGLEIVGYQFPQMETEEYDSNWLMIQIDVSHPQGDWTSTDPSLLTYEAARLAEWLEAIHNGTSVQPTIGFIEPNLEFHLVTINDRANKALRVCFQLESRPSWAKSDGVGGCDLWVEFPLDEIDLAAAAQQLREQLQQFRQRARV